MNDSDGNFSGFPKLRRIQGVVEAGCDGGRKVTRASLVFLKIAFLKSMLKSCGLECSF